MEAVRSQKQYCVPHDDTDDAPLMVSGPYSALAERSPPKLPALMIRDPGAVHAALEQITTGLTRHITAALSAGARVISLADLETMPEILGEARYREFVVRYQLKLLTALKSADARGVVHLCPRSFEMLTDCLRVTEIPAKAARYNDALLLETENTDGILFFGARCVRTELASKLYQIEIGEEAHV